MNGPTVHINGRLPLKLHTTVKGVTNLEKKLFTVSVNAPGLTGPVRVKFDQMVYIYIIKRAGFFKATQIQIQPMKLGLQSFPELH